MGLRVQGFGCDRRRRRCGETRRQSSAHSDSRSPPVQRFQVLGCRGCRGLGVGFRVSGLGVDG